MYTIKIYPINLSALDIWPFVDGLGQQMTGNDIRADRLCVTEKAQYIYEDLCAALLQLGDGVATLSVDFTLVDAADLLSLVVVTALEHGHHGHHGEKWVCCASTRAAVRYAAEAYLKAHDGSMDR